MSAVRSICGPGGSGSRFRSRAHRSHRCASRFFLFTMSVRWTVAGLSQNMHFMQPPSGENQIRNPKSEIRIEEKTATTSARFPFRVRSSQFEFPPSDGFQFLDLVADAGGLLVVLLVDQGLEPLAELREFGLGGLGPRGAARRLSGVPHIAVDTLHEWQQVRLERVVVVRAAEAAVVAELQERQPARRAAGAGRDVL